MNYTLREIELSDIETVNSWRSDPELIGHLLAPFRYISAETDRAGMMIIWLTAQALSAVRSLQRTASLSVLSVLSA